MGRTIGQQGPRPLGMSGPSNIVTASQPDVKVTPDQSPGLPALSGYYMGAQADPNQPVGPAQNQMMAGAGTDNQLDPNLMLKQKPFFGNLY